MKSKSAVPVWFVVLTVAGCRSEPAPAGGTDGRTAVPLPVEAAEAVRTEMRTMLSSLHEIHLGLARGDTVLLLRAARASGLAAAADPALEPLLPAKFLELGVATHAAFDTFALAVSGGASRDSLVSRLSGLTGNCVSCHATYRLGPTTGGNQAQR